MGATLGCEPAVYRYLREVPAICDHYGVPLILVVIMCGSGPTGYWFASEEDGLVPDFVTFAKGLVVASYPRVTLVYDTIQDAIASGLGSLAHRFTPI